MDHKSKRTAQSRTQNTKCVISEYYKAAIVEWQTAYYMYKRAKEDFRIELNSEREIYMALIFSDIGEASECEQ